MCIRDSCNTVGVVKKNKSWSRKSGRTGERKSFKLKQSEYPGLAYPYSQDEYFLGRNNNNKNIIIIMSNHFYVKIKFGICYSSTDSEKS